MLETINSDAKEIMYIASVLDEILSDRPEIAKLAKDIHRLAWRIQEDNEENK